MSRSKVDAQPAYVLHSYPFRETSLIVEVFSRDFGRVALLARGARRPRSVMRGVLMAFQPLELGWSGKGEVQTLMKAEMARRTAVADRQGTFLRLLPQRIVDEPFGAGRSARTPVLGLCRNIAAFFGNLRESDLRNFERALLQELGYGLTLEHDVRGQAIDPDGYYVYEIEHGPVRLVEPGNSALSIRGKTLIDLAHEDFADARSLQEAKQMMRALIAHTRRQGT